MMMPDTQKSREEFRKKFLARANEEQVVKRSSESRFKAMESALELIKTLFNQPKTKEETAVYIAALGVLHFNYECETNCVVINDPFLKPGESLAI